MESDAFIYGRWLCHYAFWDFFNLSPFFESYAALAPYSWWDLLWWIPRLTQAGSASVTLLSWGGLVELLLDDLWLDFWLA